MVTVSAERGDGMECAREQRSSSDWFPNPPLPGEAVPFRRAARGNTGQGPRTTCWPGRRPRRHAQLENLDPGHAATDLAQVD